MVDSTQTGAWQFGLRHLFFAVTTCALALGALKSHLPFGVTLPMAIVVLSFWLGIAILTGSVACQKMHSLAAQILGGLLHHLGYTMIGGSVVTLLFMGLELTIYLVGVLLPRLFNA